MNKKKIFIGSDHAGVLAKEEVKKVLEKLGFKFFDVGVFSEKSIDYPDFAKKVCQSVLKNIESSFGILICGSGTGMVIASNKFRGIRAVMCYDSYGAKMSRVDNNSNVLCLRAREFNHKKYEKILKDFLFTEFSNEKRHIRRIKKISNIENLN